jgi:N-acetylmuramoyl-L-alanine amidase
MSDYRDDDAQYKDWLNKRQPKDDEDVPASVTFMEMMRRAAAKQARANAPVPRVEPTPEIAPASPPDPTPESTAAPVTAKGGGAGSGGGSSGKPEPPPRRSNRAKRRPRRTLGMVSGFLRALIVVVIAAGLMATIFTWWTPTAFINDGVRAELSIAMATDAATPIPTNLPTPNWARRIGVVSGHRGPENDPGAVCPDGLTEAEINFAVAQRVVTALRGMGYTVDLLDEFDPRLQNYQAAALVSIHSNTCQVWPGEVVSGYLIAAAAARISARGSDDVLVECIASTYEQASGLERRAGVTDDMTDYHSFREIHPLTPAAILELGFMLADRDILTDRQDDLARGITDGVLCFLNPN